MTSYEINGHWLTNEEKKKKKNGGGAIPAYSSLISTESTLLIIHC